MTKYLVDGYNFLFCFPELFNDERASIIEYLSSKCSEINSSITVIFDAYNTDSPWIKQKKIGKLRVIFTHSKETADDYIIHFLQKQPAKQYTVVTEDRGLSSECIIEGAYTIPPSRFLEIFRSTKIRKKVHTKTPSKYEVEHYLNVFSKKKKAPSQKEAFKGFDDPELQRLWKLFNHLPDEQKG